MPTFNGMQLHLHACVLRKLYMFNCKIRVELIFPYVYHILSLLFRLIANSQLNCIYLYSSELKMKCINYSSLATRDNTLG